MADGGDNSIPSYLIDLTDVAFFLRFEVGMVTLVRQEMDEIPRAWPCSVKGHWHIGTTGSCTADRPAKSCPCPNPTTHSRHHKTIESERDAFLTERIVLHQGTYLPPFDVR